MQRRWPGLGSPPLIVQLVALLIGALVAAQAVTLLLTLVLPPAPPHRYALTDIAEALRADGPGDPASGFDRIVQSGPPDLSARGWFVSANAHSRLAKMMRRPLQDVALGFYTQLPVGGIVEAIAPPRRLPDDAQVPVRHDDAADASGSTGAAIPIDLTRFDVGGGAAGAGGPRVIHAAMIQQMPGGPPGGGFPGGGFPGGGFPGGQNGNGFPRSAEPSSRPPRSDTEQRRAPQGDPSSRDAPRSRDRTDAPRSGAPDDGRAPDGMMPTPASRPSTFDSRPPAMAGPPIAFDRSTLPTIPRALPSPVERVARVPVETAPATRGAERAADPAPVATTVPADVAPTAVATAAASGTAAGAPVASPGATVSATGRPVPIARAATGLLGLAPAPFVEGDFVAGVRRVDGRWLVVSPRAEGFPNAWQRRVALWFLLSLLAVAPVAWLFIRRIVGPLNDFVHAAELLGRDPGAAILPLDGPAEIGRAAHAFNQMRGRLRSFVDDRTAMIGAISHDLRTPLTRLRFRIEDVPDDQQDGLRHDVGEMEAMIASVIAFLRDASIPAARERRDLAGIVEDVIEDANLLGTVEAGGVESAIVDVDALGVRRVLNNLLTNALKYGGGYARVALTVDQGCAVADIVDKGPGVPDGELDRIFEPFYRSEAARGSNREGSGLGLAVCRSIARAHGGDVILFRSQQGFTARVILPLAFLQGRSAG